MQKLISFPGDFHWRSRDMTRDREGADAGLILASSSSERGFAAAEASLLLEWRRVLSCISTVTS